VDALDQSLRGDLIGASGQRRNDGPRRRCRARLCKQPVDPVEHAFDGARYRRFIGDRAMSGDRKTEFVRDARMHLSFDY
jgi:hypothetical protein